MKSPVVDSLYRMKRGLAGYVSYLAACEMNQSFSEYILYEPALRILTARGFVVQCEYPCPGFAKTGPGDHRKLDFVANGHGVQFAIEMKWARKPKLNVEGDLEKLQKFREAVPSSRAFLFVFGLKSTIEAAQIPNASVKEQGGPVYAEFGVTRYGCRNYEVARHTVPPIAA